MAEIDGKWAIEVATLAGSRRYDLTLSSVGTTLSGTAVGDSGPVPVRNGTVMGDTAEFTLYVVAPLPTVLTFTLRVIGSTLTGTAQSEPFPASTVVGTRTA